MRQLTFLGTGDARQVPVFGCECAACQRARYDARRQRGPCSAVLTWDGDTTLLDAGQCHLEQRFSPGELNRIWLTHYHMDHVQGLFPLRWGMGASIPVFGPADPAGCDDLFKHPGILAFQPPPELFTTADYGPWRMTPVPLQHSKITIGYVVDYEGGRLAWLCDTCGLPAETLAFLAQQPVTHLVLDCSHPPGPETPRNHNDLTMAFAIHKALMPQYTWLTHLSHDVDNWLARHTLPAGVYAAFDGMVLPLSPY